MRMPSFNSDTVACKIARSCGCLGFRRLCSPYRSACSHFLGHNKADAGCRKAWIERSLDKP